MSGALAERVFAAKLENVGFTDLAILERRPFGLDEVRGIPLFTPDVVELMERLLPADQHDRVATSITVSASRPAR